MQNEIMDIYLLLLGVNKYAGDFSGKYTDWPKKVGDLWYKGYIIEYDNVMSFLNDVQRRTKESKKP